MQVVGLISSPKYSEKQVGYTVTSVLLNDTHDFLRIVIISVREDVISRSETFQCLGLSLVANVGGREFADSLAADVQRVLCATYRLSCAKGGAGAAPPLSPQPRHPHAGDVFPAHARPPGRARPRHPHRCPLLLTGIVAHDHRGYESCIPKICEVNAALGEEQGYPHGCLYYQLPSPWLQVKCMRVLQYFPTPEIQTTRVEMNVIHQILKNTDMVKNVNKNNALHAVLFEAVQLATMLDVSDKSLLAESVATLGRFIELNEPNTYLGLNHLAAMIGPDTLDASRRISRRLWRGFTTPTFPSVSARSTCCTTCARRATRGDRRPPPSVSHHRGLQHPRGARAQDGNPRRAVQRRPRRQGGSSR